MPKMASQGTPENDAISLTRNRIPSSVKWKGLLQINYCENLLSLKIRLLYENFIQQI